MTQRLETQTSNIYMNNDLAGLLKTYRQLMTEGCEIVLATLIEAKGSTYRRAGARMLITPLQGSYGLIGGGCFEDELLEEAATVFRTGQPAVLFYDLRETEDAVWGWGLGCNGAVRIFLQKLSPKDSEQPMNCIARALSKGEQSVIATVINSGHPGVTSGTTWELTEANIHGNPLPSGLPEELIEVARSIQESTSSVLHTHVIENAEIEFFYAPVIPPNHLVIAGAGADAMPLARLAKLLGWTVTVTDDRPSLAQPHRFPEADRVLPLPPEHLLLELEGHTITAAVIMSHNFNKDEAYLRQLSATSVSYIGLLGPRERGDKLIAASGETIKQIYSRIYSPVGLDIGAELPEEIAMSILAEIQAALKDRDGQPLSKKSGPIHDRCHF